MSDDIVARARRFELRITHGLMLSFGGLVLLAVGLVLWLGLWSARENTLELTRTQAAVTLALLRERIETELRPAETAVAGLAQLIEGGALDPNDAAVLHEALRGVMIGAQQLKAILYITPSGGMTRLVRDGTAIMTLPETATARRQVAAALAEANGRTGPYWGDVLRPEEANLTLINVRRPVYRDNRVVGALAATVVIDTLSRRLDDLGTEIGGVPFVIDADGRVVAHRNLRDGFAAATPARPLPGVGELGDPVLTALTGPDALADPESRFAREAGVRVVRTDAGRDFAVIEAPIVGFAARPWRAGVYFPIEDVNAVFLRMLWAAGAGVAVLLLALAFAWAMARYLSRPILALAAAAIEVRDLHLGNVRPLAGSLFRELNDAGSAFNAMVTGLRWFEFYVPRALVHRLVRQGDAATHSEQRDVTVLFTDLAGFTTLSERLDASETADLLNAHFALIAACVEAEGGTIDKFIGDGLMAFWGAPEPQADHAARAARATLAIRAAVAGFNDARRAAGQPEIGLRVGLHSGPVVVGNIGAPGRINYTIVGDTVNVAARLEQLGKDLAARDADRGTRILASAVTVDAAGVAAEPTGRQPIRGRRDEVAVFRL